MPVLTANGPGKGVLANDTFSVPNTTLDAPRPEPDPRRHNPNASKLARPASARIQLKKLHHALRTQTQTRHTPHPSPKRTTRPPRRPSQPHSAPSEETPALHRGRAPRPRATGSVGTLYAMGNDNQPSSLLRSPHTCPLTIIVIPQLIAGRGSAYIMNDPRLTSPAQPQKSRRRQYDRTRRAVVTGPTGGRHPGGTKRMITHSRIFKAPIDSRHPGICALRKRRQPPNRIVRLWALPHIR